MTKLVKWGDISKVVWQAQNDVIDVCNISPSTRRGEDKADATELDQWTIDEIYKLLGSAVVNINSAMNKLKLDTTGYKEANCDR